MAASQTRCVSDFYHVSPKPTVQPCSLDPSKCYKATFGLKQTLWSSDRCLCPASGYEALVQGLPYNLPGDLLKDSQPTPPPFQLAMIQHVHVST